MAGGRAWSPKQPLSRMKAYEWLRRSERSAARLERYVETMVRAYLVAGRRLAQDKGLQAAYAEVRKDGFGTKSGKSLIRALDKYVGPLLARYEQHADVWKLRLLRDVALDAKRTREGLDSLLGSMDKAISSDQRNSSDLFAALVLVVAGRKKGAEKRFDEALARLERVRERFRAHRKAVLQDAELAQPPCPPAGCVPQGTLYSWLGAVRNLRRMSIAPDQVQAWDQGTVQRMREGERGLREQQGETLSVFAEIMSQGTGNASALAGGISEALITTAAGLCVAIPALVMHRYFSGRIDAIVVDLEQQTIKLVDALHAREEERAFHS